MDLILFMIILVTTILVTIIFTSSSPRRATKTMKALFWWTGGAWLFGLFFFEEELNQILNGASIFIKGLNFGEISAETEAFLDTHPNIFIYLAIGLGAILFLRFIWSVGKLLSIYAEESIEKQKVKRKVLESVMEDNEKIPIEKGDKVVRIKEKYKDENGVMRERLVEKVQRDRKSIKKVGF